MTDSDRRVAGISWSVGRKEAPEYSILRYYGNQKRWILERGQSNVLNVSDQALEGVSHVMVNVPLDAPPCHGCTLQCPGEFECPDPRIVKSRAYAQELLEDCEGELIALTLSQALKKGHSALS